MARMSDKSHGLNRSGKRRNGNLPRARFENPEFGRLVLRRLKFALLAVMLFWTVLAVRTVFIQVVWADRYSRRAQGQNEQTMTIPAPRGEVLDRNGSKLAVNWHNQSFYAYPDTQNIARLTSCFANILDLPAKELRRDLYRQRGKFTWMLRQADDRTAEKIREYNVPGLKTMPEVTRAYTTGGAAQGVLGFVDTDNRGLGGIEYSCQQWLTGTDGKAVIWRDGLGRKYTIDPVRVSEPIPGCQVELTIDIGWQTLLEDELARGVSEYNAKSGMAVLLDCRTGEIIALADALTADETAAGRTKCRTVSDVFEPGSSFKLVTFAAALAEGQISPADSFDAEMGKARFSRRWIRDDKKHGYLTVADAFRVSSNIVTGRIANIIGGDVVRRWAMRFGFGARTGIMLPAEQRGSVPDRRWSEYVTAAFSIGHGVSVNTLQLANAYASLANGGLLMQPYLVSRVIDPDGKTVYERTPRVRHRVMSPQVAARLMEMARTVVTNGTASLINDPEFPIAGKTGTAEKPDLETGRMIKNKYMASFAGFWPADKPQLVGVVVLDEPEPIHYGGWTAAPILLNVFRRGSFADDPAGDPAPRLIAYAEAAEMPTDFTSATGSPAAVESFWQGRRSRTKALNRWPTEEIPDLVGLTAREAVALLQARGLQAAVNGTGRVVKQKPAPGQNYRPGQLCQLSLR